MDGIFLVEVCWCFNIDPYLELLILTKKMVEPICIEKIVDTGISIKHFRQPTRVTVIFWSNVEIYAKTVVVGAPGMDNGNDIDEGAAYAFTLSFGET